MSFLPYGKRCSNLPLVVQEVVLDLHCWVYRDTYLRMTSKWYSLLQQSVVVEVAVAHYLEAEVEVVGQNLTLAEVGEAAAAHLLEAVVEEEAVVYSLEAEVVAEEEEAAAAVYS